MINMKLDAKEAKSLLSEPETPAYPYGLSISLENESLDKLGMALPEVGREFRLEAIARVTDVCQRDDGSEKFDRRVSLQIVELEIAPAGERSSSAQRLYRGMNP